MGVPDFLLCSSVNLIIAQRLARRVNPDHIEMVEPSKNAKEKMAKAFEVFTPYEGLDMSIFENPKVPKIKKGVKKTDAYRGRVGVYEVMDLNEDIKKAITSGMPGFEIEKIAKANGMITLEQDGIIKALQGLTTLEEVYKLVKG
jgi:type IV pilus assembly protein PilB